MIDHQKRSTLKAAAAGAVASLPLIGANMSGAIADCSHTTSASPAVTHATIHGLELELDTIPDSDSIWVRFTNVTHQPVTVRHVNPGVVQLADRHYDVNRVFDGATSVYQGESLTIDPDDSYSFIVAPLVSTSDVVEIPQTTISQHIATVVETNGVATGGVITPRMVLA